MKYFGFVILLIGALLVSSCAQWFPHTYRFKMIVEVETPQGLVMGSSVYKVKVANQPKIFPHDHSRSRVVFGQSVMVDMPNGKTLFTLMKTGAHLGDLAGLSMATLYPKYRVDTFDYVEVAKKIENRSDGVLKSAVVLPKRIEKPYSKDVANKNVPNYPIMIAFEDIKDPVVVNLLDPEDIEASFGEGVFVKRVTMTLTDEPVTYGLEDRLGEGFFKKRAKYQAKLKEELGLIEYSKSFDAQLSRMDFIVEE